MLKFRENRRKHLPGFSVAEMLLVLLIISFLILAMPPLVHKKVEKQITRGEHGRYECWMTQDGELREFYSTEKDGYTTSDSSAKNYTETVVLNGKEKPVGHKVSACEFDPTEHAPNAAYFLFQATGGGGGGSYAPYNPYDTMYKSTSYSRPENPDDGVVHLGSYCELDENNSTSTVQYCYYRYYKSLDDMLENDETSWIPTYFTPVHSGNDVVICSSPGQYGEGRINVSSTMGDPVVTTANFQCGGEGGYGVCAYKDGDKILLSRSNTVTIGGIADSDSHSCSLTSYFSCKYTSGDLTSQYMDPIYCDNLQSLTLAVAFTCNAYNPSHSSSAYCSAQTYVTDQDGTCTLEAGAKGGSYTEPNRGIDATVSAECQNLGWQSISASSSGLSYQLPSFPSEITYSQTLAYDSPSYGYAGEPGESVSMMLSKLDSKLEFTIGEGGHGGQFSSSFSSIEQAGSSGGTTTVRAFVNNSWETIMSVKGGLALSGGVAGSKIFMRGAYTCSDTTEEYQGLKRTGTDALSDSLGISYQYSTYIDGCLDNGVALYSEAKKRFSVSSGFYTLPELDADSKTPSAIDAYYTANYHTESEDGSTVTYMPGSGGDGGYSFIKNNSGTEIITAQGHNNFNKTALVELLGRDDGWQSWGDNSVRISHEDSVKASSAGSTGFEGASYRFYKCYKIMDQRVAEVPPYGGGSGDTPVEHPGISSSAFCEPDAGWPGAVIIVW